MLTVGNYNNSLNFGNAATNVKQSNNTQVATKTPNFGETDSRGIQKIPTQKTHAGLIAGSIAGIIQALVESTEDFFINIAKANGAEGLKTKNPILGALIALGGSIGCGAIVDKITNSKRENFVNENSGKKPKEILASDDRADVTSNGNVYFKTNSGKIYGTMLGVLFNSILTIRKLGMKGVGIRSLIGGAFAGFIMGAISDGCSNKALRKHTDNTILMEEINKQNV